MTTPDHSRLPPLGRRIFCNRTLNLRAIRAVGFDMDYTLIQYRVEAWEACAYSHLKRKLLERGWPVEELAFDFGFVALGLILDLERGNIVKANRFGYVKRASHGTRMLDFDEQRQAYAQVLVDLREPRWVFLNTLFALSEACIYAQLVDLLEAGRLEGVMGYADLYRTVRNTLDQAHMEGTLKGEIIADPDSFVRLDDELPRALADLKDAKKKLLLITNSEWEYTHAMMGYAFDRFLEGGSWRDLFDFVLVSARKPSFFSQQSPVFEVVEESGLLKPVVGPLEEGRVYMGGSASLMENQLGLAGDQILYVGDHIFSDVRASKDLFRWRTALVVPELEQELCALEDFESDQEKLTVLMTEKEAKERRVNHLRLLLQRSTRKKEDPNADSLEALKRQLERARAELADIDDRIGPLARAAGGMFNRYWGLLMRTGNDKSHLARQVERSADIYMSRVSNFLAYTPFAYLRSPRGSLPHDAG